MNIKAKYQIGDTVKVRADKKIITSCPFCEGKGYRLIDDVDEDGNAIKDKRYCQNCDGDGIYEARSNQIEVIEGIIKGMHIDVTKKEDDEFEEAAYIDGDMAIMIDYYVDTPDDTYYGYGTYREKQIID